LKKYFTESSIQHPAKANLAMLHFLISKYTKEGDVVLDPMSGTASTIVLANLLNRHGIAVDLEEKFCRWGDQNIKKVESKAIGVQVKGDSRKLSSLFKALRKARQGEWCDCDH